MVSISRALNEAISCFLMVCCVCVIYCIQVQVYMVPISRKWRHFLWSVLNQRWSTCYYKRLFSLLGYSWLWRVSYSLQEPNVWSNFKDHQNKSWLPKHSWLSPISQWWAQRWNCTSVAICISFIIARDLLQRSQYYSEAIVYSCPLWHVSCSGSHWHYFG